LETIGRFDYSVTHFDTPKGEFITISSIDKLFECHINTSTVSSITLSKENAKLGEFSLYVIRFKDENGSNLLSCLLQYDPSKGPGNYLDMAVNRFDALIARYGTQLVL